MGDGWVPPDRLWARTFSRTWYAPSLGDLQSDQDTLSERVVTASLAARIHWRIFPAGSGQGNQVRVAAGATIRTNRCKPTPKSRMKPRPPERTAPACRRGRRRGSRGAGGG